jgi:hypothetical protein
MFGFLEVILHTKNHALKHKVGGGIGSVAVSACIDIY